MCCLCQSKLGDIIYDDIYILILEIYFELNSNYESRVLMLGLCIFTGFNEFVTMIRSNAFDVIVVTETWFASGMGYSTIMIPGFNF